VIVAAQANVRVQRIGMEALVALIFSARTTNTEPMLARSAVAAAHECLSGEPEASKWMPCFIQFRGLTRRNPTMTLQPIALYCRSRRATSTPREAPTNWVSSWGQVFPRCRLNIGARSDLRLRRTSAHHILRRRGLIGKSVKKPTYPLDDHAALVEC
jgi:hypothetical protein